MYMDHILVIYLFFNILLSTLSAEPEMGINVEHDASIRKDEYPTFVATWTGLKEIMLSEISQAERVNYHMVSLICGA